MDLQYTKGGLSPPIAFVFFHFLRHRINSPRPLFLSLFRYLPTLNGRVTGKSPSLSPTVFAARSNNLPHKQHHLLPLPPPPPLRPENRPVNRPAYSWAHHSSHLTSQDNCLRLFSFSLPFKLLPTNYPSATRSQRNSYSFFILQPQHLPRTPGSIEKHS